MSIQLTLVRGLTDEGPAMGRGMGGTSRGRSECVFYRSLSIPAEYLHGIGWIYPRLVLDCVLRTGLSLELVFDRLTRRRGWGLLYSIRFYWQAAWYVYWIVWTPFSLRQPQPHAARVWSALLYLSRALF